MSKIRVAGTLIAADTATRELTYLLLPYGEPGRTSAGLVTAAAGSVVVPDPVGSIRLNIEHDRTRPVGTATDVQDTPAGLRATFRIANTTAGNDLLAEADDGLRPGASVEIDGPIIKDGNLIGGTLTGAAAVVTPAFPSALVAADQGPDEEPGDLPTVGSPDEVEGAALPLSVVPADDGLSITVTATGDDTTAASPPGWAQSDDGLTVTITATDPAAAASDDSQENPVTDTTAARAATAPAALTAGRREPVRQGPADLIAAAYRGEIDHGTLTAALSDLMVKKTTATPYDYTTTAFETSWLGGLWHATTDARPLVDLFGVIPATTLNFTGFVVTDGLHVDDWAGNKADIPTNVPTMAAVTGTLARMAGGVDIDRAYLDFGDAQVITEIMQWAIRDYRKKTEVKVETAVQNGAVSAGAAAAPLTTVANTIAKLVGNGGNLDGLFYSSDVFAALFAISPSFAFLQGSVDLGTQSISLGGVTGGVLPGLAPKTVLAIDKRAAQYREKVIEVSALDVAKGGVDQAVYGYWNLLISDANGMVKGTTT